MLDLITDSTCNLVILITQQVVELHQENLNLGALQCIHIGCDEVWCLGQGVETR